MHSSKHWTYRGAFLALLTIVQCVSIAALGQVALPEGRCLVEAHQSWSEVEKWVWNRLCVNEIADLAERDGRSLDPHSIDGWDAGRLLSPTFLASVLLHKPWASAVPRHGVRISGAFFDAPIDLGKGHIEYPLSLENSRFVGPVLMSDLETREDVSFNHSHIQGQLTLDSAKIGGNLFMRGGAEFANVNLQSANIVGQVIMNGSRFSDTLDMNSVTIGASLFMRRGAEFTDVDLRGASIGGQLFMNGAKVSGTLDMAWAKIRGGVLLLEGAEFAAVLLRDANIGGQLNISGSKVSGLLNISSATISSHLFMRNGAEFSDVNLWGAEIGGQLDMTRATVSGALDMDSTTIGRSLLMRESKFDEEVIGIFTRIGGSIDLRKAELSGLNMTGALVEKEFRLASQGKEPVWQEGAHLILRNVTTKTLQETPGAWPQKIDLDGLEYRSLGGLGGNVDVADRGSKWYVSWLARDEPYTPQSYEQLANVLHRMGHREEANDVLYAGRERARAVAFEDGDYWSWAGQTTLKYSIGYGFGGRYFRSVVWVIVLVVTGTVILRRSGQYKVPAQDGKPPMEIGLAYSLDMLLPIIRLRGRHYDIDLQDKVRYYFYCHQLMGYVLASFLIAGLSGLTK